MRAVPLDTQLRPEARDMAKSATQRLSEPKKTKKVVLEKDFAGVKAGQRMFVATPQLVDAYIQDIPFGETRTIPELRNDMAKAEGCDATCPVSTAIFIRIAAEAAIEQMKDGVTPAEVSPFWRLLAPGDKVTKKLPVDPNWIAQQREGEQG